MPVSLCVLYFPAPVSVSIFYALQAPNSAAGKSRRRSIIAMTFLLLGLGVAGFAVLIAYVAFCERI